MAHPSSDCGAEAYARIFALPDSDAASLTQVGDDSDHKPSPSQFFNTRKSREARYTRSRNSHQPKIVITTPPEEHGGDASDNGDASSIGTNGCSIHDTHSAEETDGASCCSRSSCDVPQVQRRKTHLINRPPKSNMAGTWHDHSAGAGRHMRMAEDGTEDAYDSWSESDSDDISGRRHRSSMRKWRKLANGKFEKMLLDCIVDIDHIAANYGDIFTSQETIDRLERTTSLSLRRPQAFSFGVLRKNKVTGAILHGPPGTGKSLLAKAVAKASGFSMISISTAEVWQKCHGDDEKMVQAIFRLARKMHPCIVFVDEADAMLGKRKSGERRHIKAMVNQFLTEWDGLSTNKRSPFILLATNRPDDLDPAVLRRAPERIYMRKPSRQERAGIIGLLLKEEILGQDVDHNKLALLTDGYTGSDLKNLCVTAATICINQQSKDTKHRVLEFSHFCEALEHIRAIPLEKIDAEEHEKFGGSMG